MTPAIAIFDIGKTNKKVFLFDEQYRIVYEQSEQFDEIEDEDGQPCEDLNRLTNWVLSALDAVLALPEFAVKAVNVTTYGASFVYIDREGKPIGPLYNYLKPFPDALRTRFLEQYGPVETLSRQTASPWLDNLNSGLQLYRLKHIRSADFERVAYALHLPQYISYLLNSRPVAELTSVGCHTLLWDFEKNDYHDWVRAEGLTSKLSHLAPADTALPTYLPQAGREVLVGIGLHDSSAALIPYLASVEGSDPRPFVLISTGTWCITLNPFNTEPLTADELSQDCLCYLTYQGKPVKASRLFAGYEHEHQTKRLAAHYNVPVDSYKRVQYDAAFIGQLRAESAPAVFAERDLGTFATYEMAYHQLMLDIMAAQVRSTALVFAKGAGRPSVSRIFVDGGFSKNPIYMKLLAEAYPHLEVWAASVAQATALGAALAFHHQWNAQPLPSDLITLTKED
jgi:L-fuculokinase